MSKSIAFLPGDGIGPEVAEAARKVMHLAAQKTGTEFEIHACPFGGAAIDETGSPFPEQTYQICHDADAVFLGAVGGPKWDGGEVRPEAGLLDLRKALGVYANLRPVSSVETLVHLSPLRPDLAENIDIVIVRELTGGIYFGDRQEGNEIASDLCMYSHHEVERVASIAFETARHRSGMLTSVDKANVLATSRLWRHVVEEVHKRDYPDVELEHVLVDAMAMKLIQQPAKYDVILTENMFGDILSDEASVITGSIGLAPSASLGDGGKGLYEPIHGSAPDIAGQDKANPAGAMLSAAMMFRHSLADEEAARLIETAVFKVLDTGTRTADLGGTASCSAFTEAVSGVLSA